MTYQVAIPSFARPAGLAQKTLMTLLNGGVDMRRVTVFLAARDTRLREYEDTLREFGVKSVVVDVPGIRDKRRAIVAHYPAGTQVLQVDDDVHHLLRVKNGKLVRLPQVDAFIREGFARTADAGLYGWGISPVANAFFMKEGGWSDGLKFCAAAWMGQIIRPGHPVHQPRPLLKEDYDISLRHWWYDGGIVRANGVGMKVDFNTPGGVSAYRTRQAEQDACDMLIRDWPGLVRMNPRRKTPEVLLASRKRKAPHEETR